MAQIRIAMYSCAFIALSFCNVVQADIVNGFFNGGFESVGSSTPASAWLPAAAGYSLSSDARTGAFSAQLNSPELNAAVLLQNSTADGGLPPLTIGDTPELSFWAKGFAGTTGNALFALRYLDSSGVILADSGNQFFHTSINVNTWTQIKYNLGAVPVGAHSAFIEFSQGIGPIGGDLLAGRVLIDDVYLGVTAVPEPSFFALLGATGTVAVLRRRQSSKSKTLHQRLIEG